MPLLHDRDFTLPDVHAHRPEFDLTFLHAHSVSLGKLGRRLCAPFASPIDGYRAIFMWLHLSIQYSVHRSETEYEFQVPEVVYKYGRARCVGYCALFKALANAAGLPAMVVGGRARKRSGKASAHAWIMVDVREWGGKRFFDPTWAARGRGYKKGVKEDFFRMELSEWAETHQMESMMRTPGADQYDLKW